MEDGGLFYDVWIMETNGDSKTQLTNDPFNQLYGAFSHDGKRIAYDSDEDVSKDSLAFIYMTRDSR